MLKCYKEILIVNLTYVKLLCNEQKGFYDISWCNQIYKT